nr:MAG TPA: hypothetical protein [Caudoviricetes sp.]
MTKREIENKIYDLKRTIKSCENIIKANKNEIKKLEAEKEKPTFERVEKGLRYYGVAVSWLGATIEFYIDNRSLFGSEMFKNNNYFLTKERAEEVADKINFLLKLERLHDTFCPDYKPDWEEGKDECKWFIRFDAKNKEYLAFWTTIYRDATVYFDSKETAKKVCEILNKELENEDM